MHKIILTKNVCIIKVAVLYVPSIKTKKNMEFGQVVAKLQSKKFSIAMRILLGVVIKWHRVRDVVSILYSHW
jgi:hypothetical protein